jgi:hypothetical protein
LDGRGGETGWRGGGMAMALTRTTMTMHSNYKNIKNCIICLFILQLMSCCGSHVMAH